MPLEVLAIQEQLVQMAQLAGLAMWVSKAQLVRRDHPGYLVALVVLEQLVSRAPLERQELVELLVPLDP